MTLSENERGDSSRRFHSTTHRRPSTPSSNHSIGPMRTRSSHTFASAPPPTTPTQPNTSSTSSSYAYNNVNSNSNSRNRSSVSASRPAVQEVELNQTNSNEFSWPILLAIIPTLGAFFAGSAEIWSDFVMILLILYYVYKWMTVPWSYYEGARSRRLIHFNATYHNNNNNPDASTTRDTRQQLVANELRRHELVGLIWVLASPAVAGYTLQYSRYFLSDYERYMSSFNVAVFVLAASLKPLSHVMLLLRERTLYLQSEVQVNETHVQRLQNKLDHMEDQICTLRHAFATKSDLGELNDDFGPSLERLAVAMGQFKEKEHTLRTLCEGKFDFIDEKVQEFDRFIQYRIDQEQRMAKHSTLATLVLLPLNITVWIAKSMTGLLPVPRALLPGSSGSFDLLSIPPTPAPDRPRQRPLTHRSSASSLRARSSGRSDFLSCPATPDPANVVY